MIKPLIFFLLFFTSISAGEIDGKGVICLIYGNTVGFFFEDSRAYEHKPKGGKKSWNFKKKRSVNITPMKTLYILTTLKLIEKHFPFKSTRLFEENAKHMKILTSLKRILT